VILPPYGLSGGSMRFDPGSLVLFVDDSLDSIQSFLAEPFGAKGKLPIQLRSRFIHERDHLFRHLASSYGMVRYGLHSLMARQFYQMVSKHRLDTPPSAEGLLGSELTSFLRKNPPTDLVAKLSQLDTVRPSLMYLAIMECFKALDGDTAFLDRDLAPTAIAVWQTLADSISSRNSKTSQLFNQIALPPETLTRFVNSSDPLVPHVKGFPFGAVQLLEFFGVMMEFAYLSNQGLELIESSDLVGQKEYFRVGSVFFGEFFQDEMKEGVFPAFPVELEAAVDLALAIPLSPEGLISAGRPLTWFDLQPGWRFLQICQHYKTRQHPWTTVPPDHDSFAGYDKAFQTIQDEACHALGWPTRITVERSWGDFLSDLQSNPAHHPLAVDLRGSGRQKIAKHLFTERLESPYSMFLKQRSGAVDRELFFPAVISREGMTAFGGLHWQDRDGDPTNWDEFLFLTGCRFFAEGFPQHPHIRFEQARGAAELISRCSVIFGNDQDRVETVLAKLLSLDSYRRFENDMASP
jgi:hypothetical protein